MTRFFFVAVAALLVSMCVELAVAQGISLSPAVADAVSAPRFQSAVSSAVSSNVSRATGPSITEQQLLSERCASLNASADWVKDNPFAGKDPQAKAYVSNAWGGPDAQASQDRQNELQRQASILGCPNR
jgi:hypothetical protein